MPRRSRTAHDAALRLSSIIRLEGTMRVIFPLPPLLVAGAAIASNRASNDSGGCNPGERSACHGAHCGEGPVLAMLAVLRIAPLLPSPTLRAVAGVMPGRDGKAGSSIEQES